MVDLVKNAAEVVGNDMTGEAARLLRYYRKAISSVQPEHLIRDNMSFEKNRILRLNYGSKIGIDFSVYEKKHVIAMGKAALTMAESFIGIIGPERFATRIALVPEGSAPNGSKLVDILEGTHPVFSRKSLASTEKILDALKQVAPEDLVFFLISGGASAMFEKPPGEISVDASIAMYEELLRCGADIRSVNTIRKHISAVKGGQLLYSVNGAEVYSFLVSDIVGDPIDAIASGLTTYDTTTWADTYQIARETGLIKKLDKEIVDRINDGKKMKRPDTPKGNNPVFNSVTNVVVGSNKLACRAVVNEARSEGLACYNMGSMYQGRADDIAANMAGMCKQLATTGLSGFDSDVCLVFGGECTVLVKNKNGIGGRVQQMAAVALRKLAGTPGVNMLFGTTDGRDGKTDIAGVVIGENTYREAQKLRLDIDKYIEKNDTYNLFSRIPGSLIRTGPTGTNVYDIVIARVARKQASV